MMPQFEEDPHQSYRSSVVTLKYTKSGYILKILQENHEIFTNREKKSVYFFSDVFVCYVIGLLQV